MSGNQIEQNAPREVLSKANVWTERPARGALKKNPIFFDFRVPNGQKIKSKIENRYFDPFYIIKAL